MAPPPAALLSMLTKNLLFVIFEDQWTVKLFYGNRCIRGTRNGTTWFPYIVREYGIVNCKRPAPVIQRTAICGWWNITVEYAVRNL